MSTIDQVVAALQRSGEQAALVEQAVGRSLLSKMTGNFKDLRLAYSELGGNDPVVIAVFNAGLADALRTINVDPGKALLDRLGENEEIRTTIINKSIVTPSLQIQLGDVPGTTFNMLKQMSRELDDVARKTETGHR